MHQPTCEERINDAMRSRLQDLETLWKQYCLGDERDRKIADEIGIFEEYGLNWDVIPYRNKHNEIRYYVQFQISTGGPGEEIRWYLGWLKAGNNYALMVIGTTFVYLDWFDMAEQRIPGEYIWLTDDIFNWYSETYDIYTVLENKLEQFREEERMNT